MKESVRTKVLEGGMNTLEAAGVMAVFLGLFLAGMALLEYLHASVILADVLDRHALNHAVKPFHLEPDGSLSLDMERLSAVTPRILQSALEELAEKLGRPLPSAVLFEGVFAVASIDPLSGKFRGLRKLFSTGSVLGSLRSDSATRDLGAAFEAKCADEHGQTPCAVPGGNFAAQGRPFMEETVLLGMKAAFSLEGTFAGRIMTALTGGRRPLVSCLKITLLRGEVE